MILFWLVDNMLKFFLFMGWLLYDGIINILNVLSDEISRYISIIINKINEVRDELVFKKE